MLRSSLVRSLSLALLVAGLAACSSPAAAPAVTAGDTPQPAAAATAAAPLAQPAAARLVFVGKANCCDCTRGRIEASWTALQTVLAETSLPVERLESDQDEVAVERYRGLRPFMAIPALYVLDGEDKLLELLQGELTAEQIRAALTGKKG